MNLDLTTTGGVLLAQLKGEVDAANAEALGVQLLGEVGDAAGVVIDLSEVRYLDSAGVAMLFDVARHLDIGRRRLGLVVPEASPLWRLVKITRLEEAMILCARSEECVELVGGAAG